MAKKESAPKPRTPSKKTTPETGNDVSGNNSRQANRRDTYRNRTSKGPIVENLNAGEHSMVAIGDNNTFIKNEKTDKLSQEEIEKFQDELSEEFTQKNQTLKKQGAGDRLQDKAASRKGAREVPKNIWNDLSKKTESSRAGAKMEAGDLGDYSETPWKRGEEGAAANRAPEPAEKYEYPKELNPIYPTSREAYGPPRPPKTKEEIAAGRFMEKKFTDPQLEVLRNAAAAADVAFNKEEGGWRWLVRKGTAGRLGTKQALEKARVARDAARKSYSALIGEKTDASSGEALISLKDKHWGRPLSAEAMKKYGGPEDSGTLEERTLRAQSVRGKMLIQRYRGATVAKPHALEMQKYMAQRQALTDAEMKAAPAWKKAAGSLAKKWGGLSKKQKFAVIALGGGAVGLALGGGTAAAGGMLGYAAIRGLRAAGSVWVTPYVTKKAGGLVDRLRNVQGRDWGRMIDSMVKQQEERAKYKNADFTDPTNSSAKLAGDAFENLLKRGQADSAEKKKDARIRRSVMAGTALATGASVYGLSNPALYSDADVFRDTIYGKPSVVPASPSAPEASAPEAPGESVAPKGTVPENLPTDPADSIPRHMDPEAPEANVPPPAGPAEVPGTTTEKPPSHIQPDITKQTPANPGVQTAPVTPEQPPLSRGDAIVKEIVDGQNAPKNLSSGPATVSKGDTTWGITERESLKNLEFKSLNRAQQDYYIDYLNKALQSHLNTLSPAEKIAKGFITGNIDQIQAGGKIDLSVPNFDEVRAEALRQALELDSPKQMNILRNRGWTPEQSRVEINKPRVVPETPRTPAPPGATPPEANPATPSPENSRPDPIEVANRSQANELSPADRVQEELGSMPDPVEADNRMRANELSPGERVQEELAVIQPQDISESNRETLMEDSATILNAREMTEGEVNREANEAMRARDLEQAGRQAAVDAVPATPTNPDSPDQYLSSQSDPATARFEMEVRIENTNQIQEYFGTPRRFWSIFNSTDDGTRAFGNIEWRGAEDFLSAAKRDPAGMAQSIGMLENKLHEFVEDMERLSSVYGIDTSSKTVGSLLMDITRNNVRLSGQTP